MVFQNGRKQVWESEVTDRFLQSSNLGLAMCTYHVSAQGRQGECLKLILSELWGKEMKLSQGHGGLELQTSAQQGQGFGRHP